MKMKAAKGEFITACQTILDQPGLTAELRYRMQRIINQFLPVMDKLYLKTVKGLQIVSLCTLKARAISAHRSTDKDLLYRRLTDLELTLEELVRTAYEFRIKAG